MTPEQREAEELLKTVRERRSTGPNPNKQLRTDEVQLEAVKGAISVYPSVVSYTLPKEGPSGRYSYPVENNVTHHVAEVCIVRGIFGRKAQAVYLSIEQIDWLVDQLRQAREHLVHGLASSDRINTLKIS